MADISRAFLQDGHAAPSPGFVRLQDPFGSLLAKAKGSALIDASQVLEFGE